MRILIALVLGGLLWSACGGGDEPARRGGPECPKPPQATLRTLAEMRRAARAVQGPAEVRRLARELAAAPADDYLGREDLLVQIAGQRECAKEAATLADRLRGPHYRAVVGRLKRSHSLREQLLHDWEQVRTRKLSFAVDDYRQGLNGTAGKLQALVPPRAAAKLHRSYLRSLRTLHRRVIRLERSRDYETARRTHASLAGLARAADRAHRRLMSATLGR